MDFEQAQFEYRKLKASYDAGNLSEDALRNEVVKLLVEDDQGRWWSIGYETGQWYVHDGANWVEGVPPAPRTTEPGGPPVAPLERHAERSAEERQPEQPERKAASSPPVAPSQPFARRRSALPIIGAAALAVVGILALLLSQLPDRQAGSGADQALTGTAVAQNTDTAGTAGVQLANLKTATAEHSLLTDGTKPVVAVDATVATFTQTPKPTATLTAAPSSTPPVDPLLIAQSTVNVRAGPGTNYPVIGQLAARQSAKITGRNASNEWWQIDFDRGVGWVSASVVEETIGALAAIPVVAAPPTPTSPPTATAPPMENPLPGRLAFQRRVRGLNQIFIYDMGTRKLEQLTSAGENHIPRWSSDGRSISFSSNSEAGGEFFDIWVMSEKGDGRQRVVSTGAWDEYAAWARDGTLAFVSTGLTQGAPNSEVFVGKPGSNNFLRLTENTSRDEWPTWSPDGKRIAFATGRDGSMDIWVMNRDGQDQRRLIASRSQENEPAWSPTANLIAYTAHKSEESEFGDIRLFNYDTGEDTHLTTKGTSANPAWSPDGQWVAFTRWVDSDGNGRVDPTDDKDLWAVNISTKTVFPLLLGPGIDSVPSWTR
jgi:TolB protein